MMKLSHNEAMSFPLTVYLALQMVAFCSLKQTVNVLCMLKFFKIGAFFHFQLLYQSQYLQHKDFFLVT